MLANFGSRNRNVPHLGACICVLGGLFALSVYGRLPVEKKPITVADCITMTRWAGDDSFVGGDSGGNVANFSLDGKRFLVVLRKGNLEKNTNEFSLYVFNTSDALHHPKPEPLLTMASSSNRDAIRQIKWLGNETIAFLGENPGEAAQVYRLNLNTRRLEKLTNHSTAITSFDITPDRQEIIFAADLSPAEIVDTERTRRSGIVIANQDLADLLAGDGAKSGEEKELFLQKRGQPARRIPMDDAIFEGNPLSLSPDGRHALIGAYVRKVPAEWDLYQVMAIQTASKGWKPEYTNLSRYLLLDTDSNSALPLLKAPMLGFGRTAWAQDGRSLFLQRTYLPLNVSDPHEREDREKTSYDIEIEVSTLTYRKIADHEWPVPKNPTPHTKVTIEQDLNTPPKLFASDANTKQNIELIDLNPEFDTLNFGEVKTITLNIKGIEMIAGLYLPPDYKHGKRYPLVIQTHGFEPNEFSMDGRSEWSSGFAARPLAARGFVVLQMDNFKNSLDHDNLANGTDKRFGATPNSSGRNLSVIAYEAGIKYLDDQGIIDPGRVGIVGFSRTVCFVGYALTHSRYRFAAASLVDGIDCGYFQYLAFPYGNEDADLVNGGKSPFGEDGLREWMKESPGFNLDKVNAPVRLLALQPPAVLEMWEWFAGLRLQHKPVYFVELPDASHLIAKPWERMTAQQGLVDWFSFWLKDEEDPDPVKAAQYERWRELRKLQPGEWQNPNN